MPEVSANVSADMASVHRVPRSPYWHGGFRQAGKLVLRSTKVRERGAAERIVMEWERAARIAERGDLTEAQSREVLADIMKRADLEEGLRAISVEEFFRDWLAAKVGTKTVGTAERYGFPVKTFINGLGTKAKRPLGAVTAADVQRYLTARLKSGVSQTTARLDVKILGIAFGRALRQGLIPANPVLEVELPAEDGNERGTFSPVEVAQLIATAEGEWKVLILIAYFTGQRLSDCAALTWEQIDMSAGTVRFKQRKTGANVLVPLHRDLQATLEEIAGDMGGPVLPGLAETSQTGRRGLSETFKGIVRKAGLDLGEVEGGGNRKFNARSFHALRHSFTSALANAGVSPEIRMKMTGHKSADQHRTYTHHEMATLAGAMAKMPGLEVAK